MDGKDYSDINKFSDQDISIYNNTLTEKDGKKIDNGFEKPVSGYVATRWGIARIYTWS